MKSAFLSYAGRPSTFSKLPLDIGHAHDHRAPRVERKVLEAELPIEIPHPIVERMAEDSRGADDPGHMQRRLERVLHEVAGVALPLIVPVDRQLSKEQDRNRIGAIALLRLWQKRPFDLRGAQRDVADDPSVRRIGDDRRARDC